MKRRRRTKADRTKVASRINRATKVVVDRAADNKVAKSPASSSNVANTVASRAADSPAVSRTSKGGQVRLRPAPREARQQCRAFSYPISLPKPIILANLTNCSALF